MEGKGWDIREGKRRAELINNRGGNISECNIYICIDAYIYIYIRREENII